MASSYGAMVVCSNGGDLYAVMVVVPEKCSKLQEKLLFIKMHSFYCMMTYTSKKGLQPYSPLAPAC